MDSSQVLKGVLDTAVLSLLEAEPGYGYDLVRRLRALGFSEIADASVYGTLRRLHKAGMLTSQVVESESGPPRKYYAITGMGRDELQRSIKTWGDITTAMESILELAQDSGR
jgi:PadR family transcriptional regulator PadR